MEDLNWQQICQVDRLIKVIELQIKKGMFLDLRNENCEKM